MADGGIELRIPNAEGIPKGSLISIRLGNVRRQALYGSDRPYRFQGPCGKREMMKVDVYMPIAEGVLFVDTLQSQATYKPELNIASTLKGDAKIHSALADMDLLSKEMSIDLEMSARQSAKESSAEVGGDAELQKVPEKPAPLMARESSAKRHQVAIEAQPYFQQHEILDVIRNLLQVMIKDMPSDPYDYMIKVLENSRKDNADKTARRRPGTAPVGGRPSKPRDEQPSDQKQDCPPADELASPETAHPKPTVDPPAPRPLAQPQPPDHGIPQPPPDDLLPMLKLETEELSSPDGRPPLSSEEELLAIQSRVRNCLTQKVKEGSLEVILSDCGFGKSAEAGEEAQQSSPWIHEPSLSPLTQPPPRSPTNVTVMTVEDVVRDDKIAVQACSDIAKECRFGLEASIFAEQQEDMCDNIRTRLRERIVEKHQSGEFDAILRHLIVDEAEADRLQKASEDIRLKLRDAFVQKFTDGELANVFDAVAGDTAMSLTPRGHALNQKGISPSNKMQRNSREPAFESTADETTADEELQRFRGRLRTALTSAVEEGSMSSLLHKAYDLTEGNATASNSRPSPSAATLPSQPMVEARHVGPAGMVLDGASPPLGVVVAAARPPPGVVPSGSGGHTSLYGDIQVRSRSEVANPLLGDPIDTKRQREATAALVGEPKRQDSFSIEVGRLKEDTKALDQRTAVLDARTAQLERMLAELAQENKGLREAMKSDPRMM